MKIDFYYSDDENELGNVRLFLEEKVKLMAYL